MCESLGEKIGEAVENNGVENILGELEGALGEEKRRSQIAGRAKYELYSHTDYDVEGEFSWFVKGENEMAKATLLLKKNHGITKRERKAVIVNRDIPENELGEIVRDDENPDVARFELKGEKFTIVAENVRGV